MNLVRIGFLSVVFLTGCASLWVGNDSALNEPAVSYRGPSGMSVGMNPPPAPLPTALYIGMNMREVEDAWGEPTEVYKAGIDRNSPNQKWVYRFGPAGQGLGGDRVVYFENGQVVGWESSH